MKNMNREVVNYVLIAFSFVFVFTCNLEAATFTVGAGSGSQGATDIPIPIDLASDVGEEVVAFNFDLDFDTTRLSFNEWS